MRLLRHPALGPLAVAAAFSLLALGLAACDIGSTDSTTAVISDSKGNIYNYSGMYMSATNSEGSTTGYAGLVFPANRQSGQILTWLRLLQYGSALEAYDNAGQSWSGNISVQNGEVASFNMRGKTTAGASVEVTGTLSYENQLSTMDATWIEPSFAGNFFAKATVSPVVTSSPPSKLTIDPSSANLSTNDRTRTFTAKGGTEPYTWKVTSASLGSVSPATGASTVYTSTHVAGNNTLTLTDSAGNTATASITYSASGPTSLSISPTSLNLSSAVFKGTFKASGGDGTYTWMVTDSSLGSVSPSNGITVTYTSTKSAGTNTVSVIDTENRRATASAIYQ